MELPEVTDFIMTNREGKKPELLISNSSTLYVCQECTHQINFFRLKTETTMTLYEIKSVNHTNVTVYKQSSAGKTNSCYVRLLKCNNVTCIASFYSSYGGWAKKRTIFES